MTKNRICIEISNLNKSFGNTQAVSDVSLDIYENEFFTILGPSGCGKSTLLRLIAGLEIQDRGGIIINGLDCTKIPANKRPVNMVFQSYALFPHMNIKDNIEFGLKLTKIAPKEIRHRVTNILDLIQMSSYIYKYPDELSGGQRQRVALARAIVNNPSIILLDEPLSALDANLRIEMQQELVNIQRNLEVTFMLVTHDQDEALSISSRIAIMENGRIIETNTSTNMYEYPLKKYSAEFLGRINIIEGNILEGSNKKIFHTETFGNIEIKSNDAITENTLLGIRPEKIIIENKKKERLGRIYVRGTIINSTYYGDMTYLAIELYNKKEIHIHVQNIHRDSLNELKIGKKLNASFDINDLILLEK
jgi:ABC-type Fe3+/spermidine/putrescine transport system ATPase subunit